MLLGAAPVGAETLNTIEARGRVLAEDLYSQVDLPHFHRAAMDGYALKAKDTFGASATLPAYIKVAGTVEMGKEAVQAVPNGAAMRISTGGMLPPGCDSVVMVEYTEDLGNGMVEIQRGVSPWQNVIQIGDDIRKGDLVFSRGRRLRAHDLGALTGIGVASLRLFKKPIVALISTGDEIVDVTAEPSPGQVRNINQHSLAGLIEEWGGALCDYGVVRDDRAALEAIMRDALQGADLLLLSGGSSVGARDITLEAILAMPEAKVAFSRHFRQPWQADHLCFRLQQTDPRFAGLSGVGIGHFRSLRRAFVTQVERRKCCQQRPAPENDPRRFKDQRGFSLGPRRLCPGQL